VLEGFAVTPRVYLQPQISRAGVGDLLHGECCRCAHHKRDLRVTGCLRDFEVGTAMHKAL